MPSPDEVLVGFALGMIYLLILFLAKPALAESAKNGKLLLLAFGLFLALCLALPFLEYGPP